MRATDAAYAVLKSQGQPMDVQDLLDEALTQLGVDREARIAARLYTDINLDSRFQYRGGSTWGLKEWQPKSSGRNTSSRDRGGYEDDDGEDLEEDDG
ncbi:MAG: DNA-directed RNA polymerase subunit delta [Sulfobacillus acidophilus]|uniref:RNAP delta factor n=1 Tax=Sulfobacillus acidophilus TaxID=53633 RepID=A0A2T2WK37_9FIRM|nr:MAG: DNA-directed RNA polymerase subunit delta [Sulfobacillus acidophilus]